MDEARFISVHGEAAAGLDLVRMQGHESLGQLFEYELELVSDDFNLDLSSVVGKTLTVQVELPTGDARYFNGVVASFKYLGGSGRFARYEAVVRPSLWLLTRSANSRIFQQQTVPDIVKEIFRDEGVDDVEDRLTGDYRVWEYVAQYGESDWNFVNRILEHEGIYYFFEHDDGKHTLVLADDPSAHQTFPGYESVPFFPAGAQRRDVDHMHAWSASCRLVSGAYAAKDFNFETPKRNALAQLSSPAGTAHDDLEVFHYPGVFPDKSEGEKVVRVRLEELQTDAEVFEAAGLVRGVGSGFTFTLTNHPREDQNQEYLTVSAWYDMSTNAYETGGGSSSKYHCTLAAIPGASQYRPPRRTPKPRVEGPQTAIVVGPAGEEIWTDKYGRVKLQFHWDRYGTSDENSSCWVRVSQTWAGSGWGFIQIPRIGQEVIVEFLEGDPDQPIVTGRVYNAVNMPPYPLPNNMTQSGVKSRSTKGGNATNANEIRFEDLKGSEELFVQAERDQTTLVKRNQALTVGANRTHSVGANESISIGANQTISVGGTRTTTVTKKETEDFKDARVMTVAQTEDLTIQKKHTGTYHLGREVNVDGADDVHTVSGVNKKVTVHGEYDITADTHFHVTQKSDSLLMQNKFELKSAGAISLTNADCEVRLESGKISLTASKEIALTCGQASVTLKQDGTIVISGGTKIDLSGAQGSIELAAAGATISGPKVAISGSASTEITGAIVKIN
jgi:type VI secretion system secreted protein VgrG